MLAPETRELMTDALRPPDGFGVELAVATTYSLNLTSMLFAPMAFALHEYDSKNLADVDPIKLLESVRRHSDHTTVFCQAGAIQLPSAYRTVLTFAEGSVHEAWAPARGRVFHPKVWVVRFVDEAGARLHRFLCLSRNMTFDRSWDTLLRLDEDAAGETAKGPDPAPLAEFVAALPDLAHALVTSGRRQQVEDLARTLGAVRFALPAGFDRAQFLPLGIGGRSMPPLPHGDRILAISAFLDATTAAQLAALAPEGILVSRPEVLDRVAADAVEPLLCYVLQRPAEVEVGDDTEEPVRAVRENDAVPEGLHAKTFVVDQGERSTVVTGSANATTAGFNGNVEFSVLLEGSRSDCGVSSMWDGTKESPGLSRLVQSYAPPADPEPAPSAEATAWDVDLFHADLSRLGLELRIEPAEDAFCLELRGPSLASPGHTRAWPITLPRDSYASQLLAADPTTWGPVGVRSITPFIAVETTAGSGVARCTRATVIKATLIGDPPDRQRDAMRDVLRTKADVLRYLAFLLGDPMYDHWFETSEGDGSDAFSGFLPGQRHDLVLFEPLVRAAARGDKAIDRVANLLADIRSIQGDQPDLVPDGLNEIWEPIWEAAQEEQRHGR